MISSGALPKVTLSRPPMPGPERSASSSVARPISAAVGMIPIAATKKITVGEAPITSKRDRERDERHQQVGPSVGAEEEAPVQRRSGAAHPPSCAAQASTACACSSPWRRSRSTWRRRCSPRPSCSPRSSNRGSPADPSRPSPRAAAPPGICASRSASGWASVGALIDCSSPGSEIADRESTVTSPDPPRGIGERQVEVELPQRVVVGRRVDVDRRVADRVLEAA